MPGTPAKVFQTPKRPLSQREFQSLREKAVKESPILYKHKVLTNPTEVRSTTTGSRSLHSTPVCARSIFTREERLKDHNLAEDIKRSHEPKVTSGGIVGDGKDDNGRINFKNGIDRDVLEFESSADMKETAEWDQLLGSFENPALSKFTTRMVNKELEMRKLISNVLAMLCWNLLNKAVVTFFYSTQKGAQLRQEILEMFLKYAVYKVNPHVNVDSIWLSITRWNTISQLLHYVFLFNIIVCLWKLLFKSQSIDVSDLKLNDRQKQLLGIVETPGNIETSSKLSSKTISTRNVPLKEDDIKPPRPFLFKTLESPAKAPQTVPKAVPSVRFSTELGMRNSVGPAGSVGIGTSLLKRPDTTPTPSSNIARLRQSGRPGYIPSSRYTYMMESPTSTKKV